MKRLPPEQRWLTLGQWATVVLLFGGIVLGQLASCARMREIKAVVDRNAIIVEAVRQAVNRDVSVLEQVSREHMESRTEEHEAIMRAIRAK